MGIDGIDVAHSVAVIIALPPGSLQVLPAPHGLLGH